MTSLTHTRVFNRTDRFVEGWYWALAAREVPVGAIRPLELLGRKLVLWRDHSGHTHAHDAHCPHMGAHLAEGTVQGDSIRCFFHHWRFDVAGDLVEIPCQTALPRTGVRAWPTEEKYGMIWVWAGGSKPRLPVPHIPELDGRPLRSRLGNRFVKGCHPNVVMINAIDEQHFHSVHPLASPLARDGNFDVVALGPNCVMFDNATPPPDTNVFTRLLGRLYAGPLTYRMVYWNGTTGSVTVGPDAQHFHIIFALRPTADGKTEGQTLFVTDETRGLLGPLYDAVCLKLTQIVGDYFSKGDTQVFETIDFKLAHPIGADRSIVSFVKHVELQEVSAWGSWEPIEREVSHQGRLREAAAS